MLLCNLESGVVWVVLGDFGDMVYWGSMCGYWWVLEGLVEMMVLMLLVFLEM